MVTYFTEHLALTPVYLSDIHYHCETFTFASKYSIIMACLFLYSYKAKTTDSEKSIDPIIWWEERINLLTFIWEWLSEIYKIGKDQRFITTLVLNSNYAQPQDQTVDGVNPFQTVLRLFLDEGWSGCCRVCLSDQECVRRVWPIVAAVLDHDWSHQLVHFPKQWRVSLHCWWTWSGEEGKTRWNWWTSSISFLM